jgi:hypothetical protein
MPKKQGKSAFSSFARRRRMSYSLSTKQKRGFPSKGSIFMQPIVTNMAALAVAMLFYLWRAYQTRQRREQVLRQRVAYMLWVMAERIEATDSNLSLPCRG